MVQPFDFLSILFFLADNFDRRLICRVTLMDLRLGLVVVFCQKLGWVKISRTNHSCHVFSNIFEPHYSLTLVVSFFGVSSIFLPQILISKEPWLCLHMRCAFFIICKIWLLLLILLPKTCLFYQFFLLALKMFHLCWILVHMFLYPSGQSSTAHSIGSWQWSIVLCL